MISKIKINNFRQFDNLEIDTNSNIVILSGDNTKGKSTIIEALHIIKTGISPWNDFNDIYTLNNSEIDNILPQYSDNGFRIEIEEDDRLKSIYKNNIKRLLKLDNQNTNSKKFFSKSYAIIFSPELIEILMISPLKRREYVDNILSYLEIEYKVVLQKYNKILRHRNSYIKKLSKILYETGKVPIQNKELEIWTNQLVEAGNIIHKYRESFLKEISNGHIAFKYITTLNESDIKEQYINSYNRDVALGYTNVGVHRDDWEIEIEKNIKKHGSRGEKRLAIIEMLFQINQYMINKYEISPTLLLDDVPSELDESNTKKILDRILSLNQQVFLTTIKLDYVPSELKNLSISIDLNSI